MTCVFNSNRVRRENPRENKWLVLIDAVPLLAGCELLLSIDPELNFWPYDSGTGKALLGNRGDTGGTSRAVLLRDFSLKNYPETRDANEPL